MSRIGKVPVNIPDGVKVAIDGQSVSVTGPKGSLGIELKPEIEAVVDGSAVVVRKKGESRAARELYGLSRTLIANMVEGVSKGFEKKLEIVGVGYRAAVQGKVLNLSLGFSHPVLYDLPEGISVNVENQTQVTVSGIDKQLVGQVAAEIRAFRKPEPYKGKGVKYADEVIKRKAGKAGKGAG
jgi:large subunit ribosomal protein L6